MINILLIFSICFAISPLDEWIKKNENILIHDIKSISFKLNLYSEFYNDSLIFTKITLGKNKKFRLAMGPRIVVSNDNVWKSYDKRTNQILILKQDKELEKQLFLWSQYNKIKTNQIQLN